MNPFEKGDKGTVPRQGTVLCLGTTDTGTALSVNYEYTDDYLTTIRTPTTTYGFTYREFGLQESIKVGDQELATYDYTEDQNRYLALQTYGNGDYISYSYDTKGRPIQVVHTDVAEPVEESTEEPAAEPTVVDEFTVEYFYDNDGNLATVKDGATGNTITHYYDLLGRQMKYVEKGDGFTHSVGYEYDTDNNLAELVENTNGTERTASYEYDDDNRITSVTTDGTTVEYTYDDFGRVTQQVTKAGETVILTEEFTYTGDTTAKTTSSQIATYKTTAGNYSVTYSYSYDDNGNITSVTSGGKTTTYAYDSANQLIRENNQAGNFTHTWTYDNAGNILERREYAYTTGELDENGGIEVAYEYPAVTDPANNTVWGDLLTGYGTKTVTYDEIGNPETFGDRTFTWEHGRQLKSLEEGNTTWNYTYDAGGMRTGRSNGSRSYRYIYNGSQLTQMKVGSDTLTFTYDAAGTPLTVTLNSTKYYYTTNIQGDITAILAADGTTAASYTYDAWGNCTATGIASIVTLNPLRYRGYVYDQETKLYYLQSRYYDPKISQWISADLQLNIGEGVLGCNMYTYCLNNPVNGYDPCGTCFHRLDFWNDCDKCGGKKLGTKIDDAASAVGSAVVSTGKAIGNAASSAWNWAKGAVQTAGEGVEAAGKAVGNFVVDRFSTPEKVSNTLSAIGWTLDVAAAYCGGIAAGLSIPSFGMSISTAGTAAAILAIASLPFHGAALVIDIFNEE